MSVKEAAVPGNFPLINRDQLDTLMVRDDFPGVIHFTLHVALIAVSTLALALSQNLFLRGVITLILGIALIFLFAPLHETIHKTAFRSPWLNRWVSRICGFVIFMPPRFFQAFHMAHHRYTQVPGKDPELDSPKPGSLWDYLVFLSGVMYWKEQFQVFRNIFPGSKRAHFIKESRQREIVREIRVFAALYTFLAMVSLFMGSTLLLYFWLLPLLVGQPFLRMFLAAEHTLCPQVPDMLENTRTTLTNGLMRWLGWNMSFHVEHHAYPAVPFHQLPATHQLIVPRIRFLGEGYIRVHREIRFSIRQDRNA